jgi:hypothetical protein
MEHPGPRCWYPRIPSEAQTFIDEVQRIISEGGNPHYASVGSYLADTFGLTGYRKGRLEHHLLGRCLCG